ncbi:hypothetical protein [Spirosoma sordidisoli]|uniref:Uncharacterized protein n=1 Tax=Spirosoma sordidisoli TaxID=2502893 RepID=A0A4Q2UMA7_9BACT|nr:hypothetical protein [Spirosoma sordidisoli]RYC70757.1 hypothetical protein EQG79_00970 [Spirosoma sordidisoli]
MKETEIGKEIVSFFEGPSHEVFCEVPCAGIIDVVVQCGPIITAVECKVSFGLAVIEQAVKNKTYAHYSYVAVPKRPSSMGQRICKDYGIGVLVASVGGSYLNVYEQVKPRLNRRIVRPHLPEFCKHNEAGVQNDRWTAFSWFVEDVRRFLRREPMGATYRQIFDNCIRHYGKPSVLNSCLQTYIRRNILKDIEYRDGRFFLSLASNSQAT